MSERPSYDWIVTHDGTQGDLAYALECQRCGTIQKIATPIIINLWCAMAKQFEKDHRRCSSRVTNDFDEEGMGPSQEQVNVAWEAEWNKDEELEQERDEDER